MYHWQEAVYLTDRIAFMEDNPKVVAVIGSGFYSKPVIYTLAKAKHRLAEIQGCTD